MSIEKALNNNFPKVSIEGDTHTATHGENMYDVYKLIHHAESLPEEVVSIDLLEGNKNGNYWHDKKGDWLGPQQILSVVEKFGGHPNWDEIEREYPDWIETINKIRNADYEKYPILIIGKDEVIDGMNRLTKAWVDGATEIKIKRFETLPEDAIYLSKSELSETEQSERDNQTDKLIDFLHKIEAEKIFDNEQSKIAYIHGLTYDEFKSWLERLNGILRDKPITNREMDGERVEIVSPLLGTDYVPPQQQGKEELLEKAFEGIKKMEDVHDMALLLAGSVTAIHPFEDGNGRTSRLIFTLLHKNYTGTPQQNENLKNVLGDEGRLRLNTSTSSLNYYVGMELYTEMGLNIKDRSIPRNLFPSWQEVRELNTNLAEKDYQALITMRESDSSDHFVAVYKHLKSKGVLDKYIKTAEYSGRTNTYIDLRELTPDLSPNDIESILEIYWELKKQRIEKMIDVFTNPEKHLLSDSEKQPEEKGKNITLKEKYQMNIQATINN